MSEVIPGTVCCLLCRGLVIYKQGDSSRFKAHLNNEHGAFFDINYLLASCLMDAEQKEQVANTVHAKDTDASERVLPSGEAYPNSTTQEAAKERSQYVCGSCTTHFVAKTAYIHHITQGCKNDALESGSFYAQEQHQDNIKQERVEHMEAQAEAFNYQVNENSDINYSDDPYEGGFRGDTQVSQGVVSDITLSSGTVFEQVSGNGSNTDDDFLDDDFERVLKKSDEINSVSKKVKDLPCGICNKMFGSNESLSKHVVKRHSVQASSANAASSDATSSKPQKEFVCSFQPCTKSFSSRQSLFMHERKLHDRPPMKKGRRSKKDILNQSSNQENVPVNEGYPQVSHSATEYPAAYPREITDQRTFSSEFQTENTELETTLEEVEPATPLESNLSSFLTDTNLGFDDAPIPNHEEDNMSQCDSQADGLVNLGDFEDKNEEFVEQNFDKKPAVDITNSKYFIKNPTTYANARGKSIKLFDEKANDLPESWKMRSIEVKSKAGGGMSTIKHFLTPDTKVLKTGLSVIEYLRLEGILSTDKILEIANKLNVSEKKLRNLYLTN